MGARPSARELALAAVRHQETALLPHNFMLSPPAEQALTAYLVARGQLAVGASVEDWIGSCLHFYGCRDKPLYASPEQYGPTITDQWGVVWATSRRDRGYPVRHPLGGAGSLDGYAWPDPLEGCRWETVAQDASGRPECLRVAVGGDLWERAGFLCGLDYLLLSLYERPAFVEELLCGITRYNLQTVAQLLKTRPEVVFFSDDYGLQRSLMMSPGDWRHFVKPHLARLFGAVREAGARVMLHSCGNVSEIVADLVGLGLDMLHPVQPEAMDLTWLKREFGRDLTFCGGLNTQQVLPGGTPAQVRTEVLRLGEELGRGGGYILEPGITVQADVPVENLVAAVEAARDFRR